MKSIGARRVHALRWDTVSVTSSVRWSVCVVVAEPVRLWLAAGFVVVVELLSIACVNARRLLGT